MASTIPLPPTLTFVPLPSPLPPTSLTDPLRHPLAKKADRDGYPCRRCLRNAIKGDSVILLKYSPFVFSDDENNNTKSFFENSAPTVYTDPYAIYVHDPVAHPECGKEKLARGIDGFVPAQQAESSMLLAVRGFGGDNDMKCFEVCQGKDLVGVCEGMLWGKEKENKEEKGDGVDFCHVHYAGPGCFAVRVDRGEKEEGNKEE